MNWRKYENKDKQWTLQSNTCITKNAHLQAPAVYYKKRFLISLLTSISLIFFPCSSVPSSFLNAFFISLLVANSRVLNKRQTNYALGHGRLLSGNLSRLYYYNVLLSLFLFNNSWWVHTIIVIYMLLTKLLQEYCCIQKRTYPSPCLCLWASPYVTSPAWRA